MRFQLIRKRVNPLGTSVWHVIEASTQPGMEFAQALAETVAVTAWTSESRALHTARVSSPSGPQPAESSFRIRHFARLRSGRALPLFSLPLLSLPAAELLRKLESESDARLSPLICTDAHFVSVAERWPGPVVYWPSDEPLHAGQATGGISRQKRMARSESRMCNLATLICPRSDVAAQLLMAQTACDAGQIVTIPEATRAENLCFFPPTEVSAMPGSERNIPRPIAGVVMDKASDLDWVLLERAAANTSWLSWVFVGPAHGPLGSEQQERARREVLARPTTYFVGEVAEGKLSSYARAFDVAVIPYLGGNREQGAAEPALTHALSAAWTPGHSFFGQLAACRPIILTGAQVNGLLPEWQVLEAHASAALVDALEELRLRGFEDGQSASRWKASRTATWQNRARTLQMALLDRVHGLEPKPETSFKELRGASI